ncbi:DNA ligase (plasmid) [Streptomyces alboflavus]|uniref:DNA ligase n=1 Tax=Streptomyces alboflavus TaxID=67267 RepID=A0A291W3C1_9ACTN|nr:NAD-dependent DNA ligase LigA [Streptomyces alboflavus]ATM24518.1 DNA ligase [Streptomyces alboflavus]
MTIPTTELTLASQHEYEQAVLELSQAARAYHGEGDSPLDDATYDQRLRAVAAWEAAHPDRVSEDSPTQLVGAGPASAGDVAHTTRLLSLGNVFSPGDLLAWGDSVDRRLGRPAAGGWATEVKLDGNAVAARYHGGRLTQIIQRGSGSHGEDISHVIGTIVGLPSRLLKPVTVEVRGEVLFSRDQFEHANEVRLAHGAEAFANARNGASGTLRARNRSYRLPLTFYAYSAVDLPGASFLPRGASHTEVLEVIAAAGVQTIADTPTGVRVVATLAEAQQRIEEIAAQRASLPFEIDGVVVKANDASEQEAAGNGSRTPHWAIAFKLPAVERMTVLKGVTWEVGRTGIIAPTAELEPVEVDGSTVSRATLHNPADIRRRDLHLGDTVTVHKAGDVIPKIEAAVAALRPADAKLVPLPEQCPNCGGAIDKRQERWRCAKGTACRLPALIEYAAERDKLDIDGMGKKYVAALVADGAVADLGDLFSLSVEQLTAASGSAKRGVKLAQQIEQAKALPLNRILCALGILGTGRSMSRRIAVHFGSMENIRGADAAALRQVEGIGAEKAPVIVEQMAELAPVIEKLIAAGVNMSEPSEPQETSGAAAVQRPLEAMTVVVTGKMTGPLDGWGRGDMNALIEKAGGRAGSSVTARTAYLVAAPAAGGKLSTKAVKAQELGVKVLTPEEFAELVSVYLG